MQSKKDHWDIKSIKKIFPYIIDFFESSFHATQSPKDFFDKLKHGQFDKNKAYIYALILSLAFFALEIPIMKKIGVDYTNKHFFGIQIVLTFLLILFYSRIFHFFVIRFNCNSLWSDTYKVFVFALFWFLLAYLPLFLEQYMRYEAMAQNPDILKMGYYKLFRVSTDGSWLITSLRVIALLLFYSMFLKSFYKGIKILNNLKRYQAAASAIGGLVAMHMAVFIIQHPINHFIIQTFKNS